jgi:hypothetical protein
MSTIHLKPKVGFSACGRGDPLTSENTKDIYEVNCAKCLRTVTAKKQKPGPKLQGDRPKVKATFSIDAEILEQLNQEQNRSATVNEALKKFYRL